MPTSPLDLTKLEQLPPVLDFVTRELQKQSMQIDAPTGLYAIVNNAGSGSIAPLELIDLNKFRTELETRILGPVALAQAFLPMIRQSRGRILWIMTPSLMPIPFVSSIHACDFAVNCIVRTLQMELTPWRIPNIMIRCGCIQSAAPEKSNRELLAAFKQWPAEKLALYARTLEKEQKELSKFDHKRTDPTEVAQLVYRVLCAKKPKPRYRIGYMSGMAAFCELLPQPILDAIMQVRG